MNIIAITDLNGGIGRDGRLLANIPRDLAYFQEMTTDTVCIMGRKTFDSIIKKNGKPLPNRLTVVLTTSPIEYQSIFEEDTSVVFTDDIISLISTATQDEHNAVFVCGGEEVYKELFPFVNTVYISTIMKEFNGVDAYFPTDYLLQHFEAEESVTYEDEATEYSIVSSKFIRKKEND